MELLRRLDLLRPAPHRLRLLQRPSLPPAVASLVVRLSPRLHLQRSQPVPVVFSAVKHHSSLLRPVVYSEARNLLPRLLAPVVFSAKALPPLPQHSRLPLLPLLPLPAVDSLAAQSLPLLQPQHQLRPPPVVCLAVTHLPRQQLPRHRLAQVLEVSLAARSLLHPQHLLPPPQRHLRHCLVVRPQLHLRASLRAEDSLELHLLLAPLSQLLPLRRLRLPPLQPHQLPRPAQRQQLEVFSEPSRQLPRQLEHQLRMALRLPPHLPQPATQIPSLPPPLAPHPSSLA